MPLVLFLLALLAGVSNPMQSGLNAQLNKQLSQPLWAAIFVYATGLFGLLLALAVVRAPLPVGGVMRGVAWWAWLGGLVSLISTVLALTMAQKMGSAVYTGATVTAALVTSMLLDQFGLIGFKQHTASPLRIAGAACMVLGLWLLAKF